MEWLADEAHPMIESDTSGGFTVNPRSKEYARSGAGPVASFPSLASWSA